MSISNRVALPKCETVRDQGPLSTQGRVPAGGVFARRPMQCVSGDSGIHHDVVGFRALKLAQSEIWFSPVDAVVALRVAKAGRPNVQLAFLRKCRVVSDIKHAIAVAWQYA